MATSAYKGVRFRFPIFVRQNEYLAFKTHGPERFSRVARSSTSIGKRRSSLKERPASPREQALPKLGSQATRLRSCESIVIRAVPFCRPPPRRGPLPYRYSSTTELVGDRSRFFVGRRSHTAYVPLSRAGSILSSLLRCLIRKENYALSLRGASLSREPNVPSVVARDSRVLV